MIPVATSSSVDQEIHLVPALEIDESFRISFLLNLFIKRKGPIPSSLYTFCKGERIVDPLRALAGETLTGLTFKLFADDGNEVMEEEECEVRCSYSKQRIKSLQSTLYNIVFLNMMNTI